ncbi:catechol O-methyltransferase domain-containing protein 1-like [Mobula birostris]|uniref:catechol O-methyltransferase domain-containing protein 1-like n=1 Tax=Mobula birostris TaxID=1983395 RepID=UPI003B285F1E
MDLSNLQKVLGVTGLGLGLVVAVGLGKRYFSQSHGRSFTSHGGAKDDPLTKYVLQNSLREHPVLQKLKQRTLEDQNYLMMVACEEAQLLANLATLIKAKKVIEIGVYTGYNTLNMALTLPADGVVVACDIDMDFANIGKPFWSEAGVEHKIDLRIKPASETLDELLQAGEAETYDFAFIDADKVNYCLYYEKCLQLTRKGGIIAIDNVLWGGRVLSPGNDAETLSIDELNKKIARDSRVNVSMLAIGDGVTLAFKL